MENNKKKPSDNMSMKEIDEKLISDFKKIIERKDIDDVKKHYVDGTIDNNGKVTLLDFLNSVQMHDTIYGIGHNKDDMQMETEEKEVER